MLLRVNLILLFEFIRRLASHQHNNLLLESCFFLVLVRHISKNYRQPLSGLKSAYDIPYFHAKSNTDILNATQMLTNILVNLLGIFVFLFIFWRKLKEDYTSGIIFTTAFYMLSLMAVGFILSRLFFSSWWFWAGILGISVGFAISLIKFNLRFYETLEATFAALSPWLALVFLADSVKNTSLISFLAFFVVLLLITFYYFLDSQYKNFHWYKSGRVGISGVITLALFFLLRGLSSTFFPFVISFAGKVEAIISAVLAFLFFLLTYKLARSE